MEYRELGRSGLRIAAIGFGCMSLGSDRQQSERLLHEAIAAGINFFDTADLYDKGANEEMVGAALKGKRNSLVLATKVGNQWRPDGSGWDWNPSKEYILASVEKSLKRLQTDYIDLYQLHGGTIDDPIDDTIAAFELLKKQGKIRHYGISSIRPNVIRAYLKQSSIVSVMMQYSLLDRRPEEECLDLLLQHRVGVLARGSLAQGLLAGKPAKNYLSLSAEQVEKAASAVQSASGPRRNPAQTAIRYTLHHPAVVSAVVGFSKTGQLAEAAQTAGTPPLADAEYGRLAAAAPLLRYQDHR